MSPLTMLAALSTGRAILIGIASGVVLVIAAQAPGGPRHPAWHEAGAL